MDVFPDLPNETNIWFYTANRALSESEQLLVTDRLTDFVNSWESHGRKVIGGTAVLFDQVIAIAGVIPGGIVSGCGIDASTNVVRELADSIGFGFAGNLDILYRRASDPLQISSRTEFRQLVSTSTDVSDWVIYDMTAVTVGDVREGRFEVPLQDSWFSRYTTLDLA